MTGTTYEETLGMLTAITEQTRNASKASRGLVQISSRLTQVLDDSSKTGAKLKDIYGGLGIELMDSNGQIRSTYDILEDLSKQWDGLTKNEKEYIALTSAGSNQVQNFMALMNGFSQAIDATTTAYKSSGSAAKENEKAMDTIGKKAELLRSQFEQLVIGKGGLQEFAKKLLDVGIGALKLVNDLGGLKTVLVALVGVIATIKADSVLNGLTKITNIIPNLIANVSKLGTVFNLIVSSQIDEALSGGATQAMSLSQALQAAGVSASVAQIAIGGLFAVLTAGIAIYSRLKQEQEQATQNAIDSANSFKSYNDTLGNTLSKIQSESTTKSQLLEINKSLNDSYDDESEKLKDINDLRDENVELLHQEAVARAKQTMLETGAEAEKQRRYLQSSNIGQESDFERVEGLTGTPEERLKKVTELLKEFEANKENLSNAELRRYSAVTSYYNRLSANIENAKNVVETYDEAQKTVNSSTDEWSKAVQENSAELENQGSQVQKVIDNIGKLASSLGLTNSQLERYSSLMGDTELENFLQHLQDIRDASNDASTGIDNLQSALETAIEAQAEYAASGDLTLDTFQSLMSINVDYLAALEDENGQLEINQQTLSNLVEQIKIAKIEEIQSAAAADLMAYSTGQVDEMSTTAKTAVATLGENIETTGTKAETASGKMVSFAAGVAAAVEASGGKVDYDDSAQQAIIDAWTELGNKIAEVGVDTTRYGNTASNAVDSLKEKYKTVIDFILKQYDKQIDKIKEAKDAAIKSVESQIKALEKEKDSKVKAIDAEITALQRERDAREKYWQDQLDKLEKENAERERNIALQEKQQALALAQQTNVMVLKDGQFQYTQDETAVAGAEQDLAQQEDQNEYERQKELIEELRDTELEWYDERIQSLEDYKEQVEEYYEEQIEQLEEYKEYLEEYYDAQIEALEAEKEAVNATLEEGAANQQEYWDKMKEQLQAFVEEWNALVGEMTFPNISGSGISLSAVGGKISASMGGKSTGDNKVSAYASGKGSIGDSEIAVVGENPKYRELVIGSKLNNDQGVVMNLKRGSGVVNAGATNTLASIFNSLNGQKSVGQPVSNSSQSMSIQIGSISLPEVKDGQGFVDYLQNFSADITQQSFRRV